MKRYLVFAGYNYYPYGAMDDLQKMFEEEDYFDAIDYVDELMRSDYDWIKLYDMEEEAYTRVEHK